MKGERERWKRGLDLGFLSVFSVKGKGEEERLRFKCGKS